MHSRAVQDYLKAIYEIQSEHGRVSTSALAERMGITPASASGMVKKLAEMNLVNHKPYQGAVLTQAGRKVALKVLRQHRLVERFLHDMLDVPWDRVHEEAHRIEHVLSDYLEEQIDSALGHPTTDQHGAAIPTREGTIAPRPGVRLIELLPGQSAIVAQVSDRDSEILCYLDKLGIRPGTKISVIASAPFDGPLTVRVGTTEHSLGYKVASTILVTENKTGEGQHPPLHEHPVA